MHRAMHCISRALDAEGIAYAVIGNMAANAHGYERVTTDVDVLITRDGLERIHERIVGRWFHANGRKSLQHIATRVRIDFIVTGDYPGDGQPKAVAFPDPRDVSVRLNGCNVIRLYKLVELKLASGVVAPYRLCDLGDVVEYIKKLHLPRDLGNTMDPSVRDVYYEYWAACQVPDPFDEEATFRSHQNA
jgi:hypothetical protein